MLRPQTFTFLLISFSLCISVGITQHVRDETANLSSISRTKKRPFYETRPTSSKEKLKRRSGGGLTWDPCEKDADCVSPRTCRKLMKNGKSQLCNSRPDCLCDITIELASTCIYDLQCPRGEFCYLPFKDAAGNCFSKKARQFKYLRPRRKRGRGKRSRSKVPKMADGTGSNNGGAEYAVSATPSSQGHGIKSDGENATAQEGSTEGGKFCIGINSLTHLPRSELKFERDIEAKVLCDEFQSCATSGHVVMWNGRGMMMSSYCKETKCYERVMLVNSPKEARYVRVKSKTAGLMFSGYSARYGTQVEETVFRMLTRLGL